MFPVNGFLVFLITKCFMLDVKGFLDSPLDAIHQTCKSSQLTILNVFKFKMRFLQFWCKLKTRRIVKTCLFRFLRDNCGDSLNVMFPSFLTISYRFSWCFRMLLLEFLRFPQVFLLFPLSVSPVFYFRFCVKFTQLYSIRVTCQCFSSSDPI